MKPKCYIPSDKVWLNSKYIKTKQNCTFKAKFFGPFQELHLVRNLVYKLELPKKWKIHDVFHISLLEYDITKNGLIDETTF